MTFRQRFDQHIHGKSAFDLVELLVHSLRHDTIKTLIDRYRVVP